MTKKDDHKTPFKPLATTTRNCLKCGKSFKPSGKGNRICPKCNGHNTGYAATKIVAGHTKPIREDS